MRVPAPVSNAAIAAPSLPSVAARAVRGGSSRIGVGGARGTDLSGGGVGRRRAVLQRRPWADPPCGGIGSTQRWRVPPSRGGIVIHPGRCRPRSPRRLRGEEQLVQLVTCGFEPTSPEPPMGGLIEEHSGCHVATSVLVAGRRARVRWAVPCTEEAPRCRDESRRAFVRPERVE
jgi:hypothetical protein